MLRQIKNKLTRTRAGSAFAASVLRQKSDKQTKSLRPLRTLPQPSQNDLVCITCLLNERARLPEFLRHYREMGISRFSLVDHNSNDGSQEYLLQQPDVELFTTDIPFPKTRFGTLLLTGLARRYGLNRWYLHADIDEHLVFDGSEQHSLHDLIPQLEAHGQRALPAMLLDMYPDGPLKQSATPDDSRLLDICPMFDGTGYVASEAAPQHRTKTRVIDYQGGPRQRLFSTPDEDFHPVLAKTALVKWDRWTVQTWSHGVYPVSRNFGPVRGCLLHFKLMADLQQRAAAATASQNYYRGSYEQKRYRDGITENPEISFLYSGSRRYESSKTLVDAGLMPAIKWD